VKVGGLLTAVPFASVTVALIVATSPKLSEMEEGNAVTVFVFVLVLVLLLPPPHPASASMRTAASAAPTRGRAGSCNLPIAWILNSDA
jgi:hypothetical protein